MEKLQGNIDKNFHNWMNRLGEDGRMKMIEALDEILERLEEEAQIVETGPDGQLRLVKKEKT